MLAKTAFEIAKDCGLETVGEALMNIGIHAISIFGYEEVNEEMTELHQDIKNLGLSDDDLIPV